VFAANHHSHVDTPLLLTSIPEPWRHKLFVVAADDLGKVIGRGGRTAKALRQVMTGVGGRGLRVDVVDTDGR
jgi:predicted RNA-binding protein YlqC (UPF0109 family)